MERYVVGVDFGTLSGRAVVIRTSDGAELASAVSVYRHGVIERALPATGEPLPPGWALQVPGDYLDVLREAVPAALSSSGISPVDVVGIGTAFTACTMVPTLSDGTPLCEIPEYRNRPHAYAKLWRHHAAQGQADRINASAAERGEGWLMRYGGRISAEWEFAKALQLFDEDPELYAAADRWIECADWIVWRLTGQRVRSECCAGYKGIWQEGTYPSRDYLRQLDPRFEAFVDDKLVDPLAPPGERAGSLTEQAARWTGLPAGIAVCVGNVDAHVTAAAARTVSAGPLLAVMGTSTCHVVNSPRLVEVPGMCGTVRGGVVPGLWAYEAGQSGVGDIFGWFVRTSVPPAYFDLATDRGVDIRAVLCELAGAIEVGQSGLLALDWHSGNRSVLVDHELTGLVVGQTLQTTAEEMYRALIESTAFGARVIVEAFESSGVPVTELVIGGGLAKNRTLMQIYADVMGRPLSVIASEQGPALGAGIYAAVAAGLFGDVASASDAMGGVRRDAYHPDARRHSRYDVLYMGYRRLHDHFGRGGSDVMHRLLAMRRQVSTA